MSGYTFASGETWGEEPPTPAPSPLPREGTKGERLAARARRRKTDPAWATRTPAEREALLTADVRDGKR